MSPSTFHGGSRLVVGSSSGFLRFRAAVFFFVPFSRFPF